LEASRKPDAMNDLISIAQAAELLNHSRPHGAFAQSVS
jgi:hypothetical protein